MAMAVAMAMVMVMDVAVAMALALAMGRHVLRIGCDLGYVSIHVLLDSSYKINVFKVRTVYVSVRSVLRIAYRDS